MKRIRIIISVALLLVTLSGCGTQKSQNSDSQTNNSATTEATTDKESNTINTNSDAKDTDNNTKKDNTSTNSNKMENSTNSNTDNNSGSQDTTKPSENEQDNKSFYGNWQIKKVAGYAKVSTGDDESLIGLKITLSKDSATLGNKSYDNPKYEITNKTKDTIASSLNTNLSNIGVNANSIDELDVLNEEGTDVMTLFIKDNNTLIYYLDGTYYETTRVS